MQHCFCGHSVKDKLGCNLMFKMVSQIVTTENYNNFILETSLSHGPEDWI